MKNIFAVLLLSMAAVGHAQTPSESQLDNSQEQTQDVLSEEERYQQWAQNIWDSLDRQTGEVELSAAGASLNVPDTFYYLNSADSEIVLADVWGNPPGQRVLGMLFPADMTPFDRDAWAVTVEYEEDGYVDDKNAMEIDYDDLLKQMQKDTRESNKQRVASGYESISLIGWAASPFYDQQENKLHWAKELSFGDAPMHTLNYNIRILGRKGVLVLNFIAGMDQQALIEENLDSVLSIASFNDGSRYSDFNPDIDKVAAYGIGALVAGKVIAKTGFFALALVFLKKFGVFIVMGVIALGRMLFGRKRAE